MVAVRNCLTTGPSLSAVADWWGVLIIFIVFASEFGFRCSFLTIKRCKQQNLTKKLNEGPVGTAKGPPAGSSTLNSGSSAYIRLAFDTSIAVEKSILQKRCILLFC